METRSISSKIPAELHHWIKTELRPDDGLLSRFIELIIERYYELKEEGIEDAKKPEIVLFPISDELSMRITNHLAEYKRVNGRKLTQAEFMIGLIERALDKADEEFEGAEIARSEAAQDDAGTAE